jgi:hypothetical protein
MSQRSPLNPSADAPLSKGLVVGWTLFMVFTAVGLGIALGHSPAVPLLLDGVSR